MIAFSRQEIESGGCVGGIAIAYIDRATRVEAGNDIATAGEGFACYNNSDLDHAIPDFDRAIWLNPGFTVAFNTAASAMTKRRADLPAHFRAGLGFVTVFIETMVGCTMNWAALEDAR
jgi:hypothetical protein